MPEEPENDDAPGPPDPEPPPVERDDPWAPLGTRRKWRRLVRDDDEGDVADRSDRRER